MTDQPDLFNGAAVTRNRRRARDKAFAAANGQPRTLTADSFQNFPLQLGMGTPNALSDSSYGFNPITRIRTLLEWVYRGSWIGGVAVDCMADDMTREGVDIIDPDLDHEQIERIHGAAARTGVWSAINETYKWGRLYGGAIGVPLIDGQDMSTPLRDDTVRPGQFKGMLALDRWSVTPSTTLVQDYGPRMGEPEYYAIGDDAPGLRGKRIHYSRCLRQVGVELPWNQRVAENLWGLSVLERLYDRMIAFDSATQGAAQLVYKSAVRTYKIKGMRQIMAAGGDSSAILVRYADMIRRFQGIEGMTLIDADDDMVTTQLNVQSGISDALVQFGQQLSGALQIPLVRLFGQSPAGLNATGESDLRNYYDGIKTKQARDLGEPVLTLYRALARSEGIQPSNKFAVVFRPLWQLTEEEKSVIAERDARSIADLEGAAIIDKPTALRDLRTIGKTTGRFQNVTDEMIEAAAAEPAPEVTSLLGGPGDNQNGESVKQIVENDKPKLLEDKREKSERRESSRDAMPSREWRGLQMIVETFKGDLRHGPGWTVKMPADYGYIRGTSSAEGKFEQMDCFIRDGSFLYVIDGARPDGSFDEHKVMVGYDSEAQAFMDYVRAYQDHRKPLGITRMEPDAFKRWCETGDMTVALSDRRPRLVASR